MAECGKSIPFKSKIYNIGDQCAFDFTNVNYDFGKITIAVNNNIIHTSRNTNNANNNNIQYIYTNTEVLI